MTDQFSPETVEIGSSSDTREVDHPVRWWLVLVPVLAVVGMAVLVPGGDDPTVGSADPSALRAPDVPDVPEVVSTIAGGPETAAGGAIPPEAAALAAGWTEIDLAPEVAEPPIFAHGGLGWLAVTGGRRTVVYTPTDANSMRAQTLPGDTPLGRPSAAVGEDLMVVVTPDATGLAGTAWVSRDGQAWTEVGFPAGRVMIESLLTVGDEVFVLVRRLDVEAAQELWMMDSSTAWTEIVVVKPPQGTIRELVTDGGGLFGFGESSGRPSIWVLEGDRFAQGDLTIPDDARGFRSVLQTATGTWLATTTDAVYQAVDLLSWTEVLDRGVPPGWVSAIIDGQIASVAENAGGLDVLTESGRYEVAVEGTRPIERYVGLVSSPQEAVLVLDSTDDRRTLLRGRIPWAVEAVTPDSGRWSLAGGIDGSGASLRAGSAGGEAFLFAGASLYRVDIPGLTGSPPAVVGVDQAYRDLEGDTHFSIGSRVYTYTGGGLWSSEQIDVEGPIAAMAQLGDRRVVHTWSDGSLRIESEDAGWSRTAGLDGFVLAMTPVRSGVFVVSVRPDEQAGPSVSFTADGTTWIAVDGQLSTYANPQSAGEPFLIRSATKIDLIEGWPDVESVTLPQGYGRARQVERVDGELRVLMDGAMVLGDGVEPWTVAPIDLEHGVPHDEVVLLPGEQIRLAASGPDGIRILVWE